MFDYEVLYVIDPALEEDKKNETVEKVKGIIDADGQSGETDIWGLRKLAYPIEKKSEGFYVVQQFQASADLPKELDRRLRISDDVMRHIIVRKEEK